MAVTYNDFIYSCYRSHGNNNPNYLSFNYGDKSSYADNQALEKYIHIDISKDRFEIPCIYKYIIGNVIASNGSSGTVSTVDIPLIVGKHLSEVSKSANPILKTFFMETNSGTLLCKKKAGTTTYIGGEGIILYEDLTPLIMFTMEVEKVIGDRGIVKYAPVRQILRINPIIYSKDDLLAKHIRTYMIGKLIPLKMNWDDEPGIPWIMRKRTLRNIYSLYTKVKVDWDFKIIIEDFSRFFKTPTIPDCTFDSAKVNEFLCSKCDDIISDLRL